MCAWSRHWLSLWVSLRGRQAWLGKGLQLPGLSFLGTLGSVPLLGSISYLQKGLPSLEVWGTSCWAPRVGTGFQVTMAAASRGVCAPHPTLFLGWPLPAVSYCPGSSGSPGIAPGPCYPLTHPTGATFPRPSQPRGSASARSCSPVLVEGSRRVARGQLVTMAHVQVLEYDYYGAYGKRPHQDYAYGRLLGDEYTFDFPPHHHLVRPGLQGQPLCQLTRFPSPSLLPL